MRHRRRSHGCAIKPVPGSLGSRFVKANPGNQLLDKCFIIELGAGTYNGTITITDPNASNSPQTVNVTLKVYAAGNDQVPFGSFDTPVDGSIVMSSIPVTGWALDDIEVESVKIYRDPVSGEGTNHIYIGDAVFVEGARPDVENNYPEYPLNYRAGWGYMMLTNFLPNQGNGTFVIYAKATDKEGNQVILGSKTITCDNENAVKPFGAIDTPTQGGTVSGTDFVNFGWVLTPLPNSIPVDGSTINVIVDGVNIGNPTYNQYRQDIADRFPGYNNSDGAVGYYVIDTTGYENGVHTIAWAAEDSAGNVDGIGSRYFNIFNGSTTDAETQDKNQAADFYKDAESLQNIMPAVTPIRYTAGYKSSSSLAYPEEPGIYRIEISEVQPLIISLNPDSTPNLSLLNPYPLSLNPKLTSSPLPLTPKYSAWLKVGNQLRPLPIGSTFEPKTGIFTWLPGPGFIGEYELVFVRSNSTVQKEKIKVKVTIKPKEYLK